MPRMTHEEVLQCFISDIPNTYVVWFKKQSNGREFPKAFTSIKQIKPWIKCHPSYILTSGSWQVLEIEEQIRREMNH